MMSPVIIGLGGNFGVITCFRVRTSKLLPAHPGSSAETNIRRHCITIPQRLDFAIVHRQAKNIAMLISKRPYDSCDLNSVQREMSQVDKIREFQRPDLELSEMIDFLESDIVPSNDKRARKVWLTSDSFY